MNTVAGKRRSVREQCLQDAVKSEEFMMKYDTSYGSFDPVLFFLTLNNRVPACRLIRNIEPDQQGVEEFARRFRIGESNELLNFDYDPEKKRFMKQRGLFRVKKNLLVYFDIHQPDPAVCIYYTHDTDGVLLEEVSRFFIGRQAVSTGSRIGMLVMDPNCGLYVKEFKLNLPEIDLGLCYNDDFAAVNELIVNRLSQEQAKGIVLLHGRPGTGKTTYIRHLASVIRKPMIFIPPDLAGQIASPDFLALMVDHPNSILVIEDAENVIRDRMGDENLSVANLLNISDGLLSDCLHLQLICTFNTDISRIDKALLRKGRIIARYEFGPLARHKTEALSARLGCPSPLHGDMTLAEICHQGDPDFGKQTTKTIGFRAA